MNRFNQVAVVSDARGRLALARVLQAMQDRLRYRNEAGDVTSTTIIIFVLAVLAVSVGAIFTRKITAKANSINLDG